MIYFDHAATTPIDEEVLLSMMEYERGGRGNPGRGLHAFAQRANDAVFLARQAVARFVSAEVDDVIFTKGTTESCNLVARGFASTRKNIVLTAFDHHATLFPWTKKAQEEGFEVRVIPAKEDWTLDFEAAARLIDVDTAIVIAPHVSNVTGTILPIAELGVLAHAVGAFLFVDAAQSVGHLPVSVRDLGCDGLAFSGHKMYGPMGAGVLVMNEKLRALVDPLLLGGGMFGDEQSAKYEAGTLNVTGIVGLAKACEMIEGRRVRNERGMAVETHSMRLLNDALSDRPAVELFVPPVEARSSIVSFGVRGVHAHDVAQSLADRGVAVRAGYHCAEPLAKLCRADGTVRASLGKSNTKEDVAEFLRALDEVIVLWTT